MKKSTICGLAAVVLTNLMVAVVAYQYGTLRMGMLYAGFSAAPRVAFLCAVPFLPLVLVLTWLALRYRKKGQ